MEQFDSGVGLLRLPNEVLLQIFEQLDSDDQGIFAISTSCRRLHFLALPIYLAGYGIYDAPALEDLALSPDQLDVLGALRTALFIPSLKHISCSFSLNTARPTYSTRNMDNFFRHLKCLAGFLLNLQSVDEVTLDFKDLNFWAIGESLSVLEAWASAISTLLDAIVEKQCKKLKVVGGMFMVHPSQFQPKRKPSPRAAGNRWSVVHDVGRRIGSAFVGRADLPQILEPGKPRSSLRTFNIHSRVLLLHPCFNWTMAALRASHSLISLSIMRVDIPERSWDDILSNIHAPSLEILCLDLDCKIKAEAFDQFLARHPLISTLTLGRDLTLEGETSKDCLRSLINLTSSPTYARSIMADKRAPAVRNVRLLVKVASHLVFKAESINRTLAPCHTRLEHVHLTLVVSVDYVSSHWTGFFPDEAIAAPPKKRALDSLRYARALEMVSKCPSDAFEALALRWLPSFPALESISFTGCLSGGLDELSFVRRVKEACPEIQLVTLDGITYDPGTWE
ncbi:hypothetical protein B0H19DRAFT_1251989 [Mycena capillaripes]|nr:hypothetical protein B0H19DRAFT_1251989 [Mycena capillaripes]